jgi:hypothetical protein
MKEDEIIAIPYEEYPNHTINFYFSGLIDNVLHDYHSDSLDIDHQYSMGTSDASSTVHSHSYISKLKRSGTPSINRISVSTEFHSYNGIGKVDDAIFRNYFGIGSYTFRTTFFGAGIYLIYTDDSGIEWSTLQGTANQQNSFASIIEVNELDYDPSTIYVLFSFNCTVYDGAGNSKEITNAHYYGQYTNFETH